MSDSNTDAAQQIVQYMAHGDFASVEQRLASAIKALQPAGKLQATWQHIQQQVGSFQRQVAVQVVQTRQGEIEVVTCAFERANLDVNISFSVTGEILRLTITPVGNVQQQEDASYLPPPYARPEQFVEEAVQIGQGEWTLPGTLTLPTGTGPFRAVLLVHGSGPNDRDETLLSNKPFRDLAWGLAAQGIATLRYDKRAYVYGARMNSEFGQTLTVQEEVIDDVLAAVARLRLWPEIDAQQIYVLGHSLGGYLAPRIGAIDPGIKGLILLAASARPLEDGILEQVTYIASLDTTDTLLQQQQVASLKKQVERVKDAYLSPTTPSDELPLGIPATYWLDLRTYQPTAVARRIRQPMLILQAESDYQVTQEDFQRWHNALARRNGVQFKRYPGLSHLFIPVEGGQKATPTTYSIPGHVAEEVIQDISDWIKKY